MSEYVLNLDFNSHISTSGNSTTDVNGNSDVAWFSYDDDSELYCFPIGTIELQENNRKEINDMFDRQTLLDALADEGKPLTSEEREIVRDAKLAKLELLTARLLVRAFEPDDLAMLKEKPKEVLVKEA